MPINSKIKGKQGEAEFVHFLKKHFQCEARRGLQYSGSPDSPDVVSTLPFYFEVKRREFLNVFETMAKTVEDANGSNKTPIIAWRKNREDWLLIIRAEDFAKEWLSRNEGKEATVD